MTEFRGVTTDKRGNRRFLYECRCCGKSVQYKTKHKEEFGAICSECKKINARKAEQAKKKAYDDAIWDEAVMTMEDALLLKLDSIKTKFGHISKKQIEEMIKSIGMEMRHIEED